MPAGIIFAGGTGRGAKLLARSRLTRGMSAQNRFLLRSRHASGAILEATYDSYA
jgi:hypothetical protein